MKLYTLLRGKSKTRLKPVMIDSLRKVENYRDALSKSGHGDWFAIEVAPPSAVVWRKHNNYGQWTNYNASNPPLVKNGSRV